MMAIKGSVGQPHFVQSGVSDCAPAPPLALVGTTDTVTPAHSLWSALDMLERGDDSADDRKPSNMEAVVDLPSSESASEHPRLQAPVASEFFAAFEAPVAFFP